MAYEVVLDRGYVVSDDKARLDLGVIHGFLAEAYWSRTRAPSLTERAIAHCLCLGLYAPDRGQIGFARVLSDYAMRAHLADVFVLPAHRGHGLGRALVAATLDHPALREVATWTLSTSDAHRLYASFGFGPIERPETMMMRVQSRPDRTPG